MIPEIYENEVMDALSAIESVFDDCKDLKQVSKSVQFGFVKLGALPMAKKLLDKNGDLDLESETATGMVKIAISGLCSELNHYRERDKRGEL